MRGDYRIAMGIYRDSPRVEVRVPILTHSANGASLVAEYGFAPYDDVIHLQVEVLLDSLDAEFRRMDFIQVLE